MSLELTAEEMNPQPTPAHSMLKLSVLGINCIQKAGNSREECEDYCKLSPKDAEAPYYYAVADGATESSFSDLWALGLVNDFVERPFLFTQEELVSWLSPLQEQWAEDLTKKNLPWFAKRKVDQGTYSTLLGLKIEPDKNNRNWRWEAVAVGDSCLFVVQEEKLLSSFPLSNSSELNSTPYLIGTLPKYNQKLMEAVQFADDIVKSATHFYLVTDALAGWIFKSIEAGLNPWSYLNNIRKPEEFSEWINQLRDKQEIRNDDTTLINIYLYEPKL